MWKESGAYELTVEGYAENPVTHQIWTVNLYRAVKARDLPFSPTRVTFLATNSYVKTDF